MKLGGRHNAYQGGVLAFGRPVNTIYHFDQADVIVSLDADFLACGPGNLRHARQFADRRRVQSNVTHTPQPKEDWQEGYQEGSIPPRTNQSAQYAADNRGPVRFAGAGAGRRKTAQRDDAESAVRGRAVAVTHRQHGGSPLRAREPAKSKAGPGIWPRLWVWAGSPAASTRKLRPSRRISRRTKALRSWLPATINPLKCTRSRMP